MRQTKKLWMLLGLPMLLALASCTSGSACQEFFLHYAKLWQRYYDLNALKRTYEIDTHSVNINRINGIVPLFDDWYRLFNVTGGQLYLAPEKRVRI